MNALILAADGFDDLELYYPWFRLQEEGLSVTLAGPGGKTLTGQHGYRIEPDMPLQELNSGEYDLLLIPGGQSPERLRLREDAVDIARTFMGDDRRVVAICRGPQLLISAGALGGPAPPARRPSATTFAPPAPSIATNRSWSTATFTPAAASPRCRACSASCWPI